MQQSATTRAWLVTIPAELLDEILGYLNFPSDWFPGQDLVRLSLTCKHLRASVEPVLYKHVKLGFRPDRIVLLLRTLLENTSLAQHIRVFEYNISLNSAIDRLKAPGDDDSRELRESFMRKYSGDIIRPFTALAETHGTRLFAVLSASMTMETYAEMMSRGGGFSNLDVFLVAIILQASGIRSLSVCMEIFDQPLFQRATTAGPIHSRALPVIEKLFIHPSKSTQPTLMLRT